MDGNSGAFRTASLTESVEEKPLRLSDVVVAAVKEDEMDEENGRARRAAAREELRTLGLRERKVEVAICIAERMSDRIVVAISVVKRSCIFGGA